MLKKAEQFLEKWGHYLLAALCAAAILLSGLWTRAQREGETPPGAQALSDASQRLSQVTQAPPAFMPARPCAGEVMRPFSEAPIYFAALGAWQTHPAVDFAAEAGDEVLALGEGTVESVSPELRLDHGNGYASVYRGLSEVRVRPGQAVRAGQAVGTAGGWVPFEGGGHVCVALLFLGAPTSFGADWLTN